MAEGGELPRDGHAVGDLLVRGPWIVSDYFKNDGDPALKDGWFSTGDVATIDADGYLQITDRSKDMIKSGGEWISSIELENLAAGHPAVAEAAVIGIHHPKWGERPLLVVVRKEGHTVTRDDLLDYMRARSGEMVAARRRGFRGRTSPHRNGKTVQNQVARAVQELPLAHGLTRQPTVRSRIPVRNVPASLRRATAIDLPSLRRGNRDTR